MSVETQLNNEEEAEGDKLEDKKARKPNERKNKKGQLHREINDSRGKQPQAFNKRKANDGAGTVPVLAGSVSASLFLMSSERWLIHFLQC